MFEMPFEIIHEITSYIRGDFISWTSTCKALLILNTVSERKARSNHLTTLIKMFPKKNWDWPQIMYNNCISFNQACYYIDNDFIPSNQEKNIDYDYIYCKADATIEKILKRKCENYDWCNITQRNPNITLEVMQQHPEINWNMRNLYHNSNLTEEIISKFPPSEKEWEIVKLNTAISLEFIEKERIKRRDEKPFYRKDMSFEQIQKNLNHDTKIFPVSSPSITLDIIKSMDLSACKFRSIVYNPNLTIDWIYYLITIIDINQFDWSHLSSHPGITTKDILENNFPWEIENICANPNITCEFLKTHPYLQDNYIAINPAITWEIVVNNPEFDWHFGLFAYNEFGRC